MGSGGHLMIFASPLVKIISSASNWKLYKNNEKGSEKNAAWQRKQLEINGQKK